MLDQVLNGPDGWIALKVIAILIPVLVFVWIVATVTALHRRDVYFWRLGSTWTGLIAGPAALAIMSQCVWRRLHDPNAPLFMAPVMAGLMVYAVSLAYAAFYNFRATKSALLAFSTCMLQLLTVLGLSLIWLRWNGDRVNRGLPVLLRRHSSFADHHAVVDGVNVAAAISRTGSQEL
jgi:hypothetical protein